MPLGWFLVGLVIMFAAREASAQWAVTAGVEYFSWRERTSPIEVRETGPRFAVGAGYTQPRAQGIVLAGQGRLYGGGVGYEGSFQFDATEAARGTSTYLGATVGADLRYRWQGAVDAVLGLDVDLWRRRLSASQHEDYRILSARLGLERGGTASSPFLVGGGIRFLLLTDESATVEEGGFLYRLELTPGLGANPYLHVGQRVAPPVMLIAYWDGMRLGRSNKLTLIKRGEPQAIVSQPESDVNVVGIKASYAW